jgi:hypothetical protein
MNLNCIYCRQGLDAIQTSPISDWQGAQLYVCLNDSCSYYKNSWDTMRKQGHAIGYRYYCDELGNDGALLVSTKDSYRDCLIPLKRMITKKQTEPSRKTKEALKSKERSLDDVYSKLRSLEKKLDMLVEHCCGAVQKKP